MTDLERYQAMTDEELEQELYILCEQLRLKVVALPDTPAYDRVRRSFADVHEVVDRYRRRKGKEIT